jgi:hypothetical protein
MEHQIAIVPPGLGQKNKVRYGRLKYAAKGSDWSKIYRKANKTSQPFFIYSNKGWSCKYGTNVWEIIVDDLVEMQAQIIASHKNMQIRIQKRLNNEFRARWKDAKDHWWPIYHDKKTWYSYSSYDDVFIDKQTAKSYIEELYQEIKSKINQQISQEKQKIADQKYKDLQETTPWSTIQYHFPDNIQVEV